METRPLPSAPDAELALIAAVLCQHNLLDALEVAAQDFSLALPRALWTAMLRLRDARTPVDFVTAAQAIPPADLDAMGGPPALKAIFDAPGTATNAAAYAAIIRDTATARRIITTLNAGAAAAHDSPQEAAATTARRLDTLLAGQDASGPLSAAHAVDTALVALRALLRGDPRRVTPTGYADLDALLGGGLEGGQLALLGARPAIGKSSIAASIAAHAAQRHGTPALFVSLEMPAEQIVSRLASAASHVALLRARTGRLTPEEYRRYEGAALALAKAPLFLDYSPAITLSQLSARARRLKREQGGLGLIVLDYVQLMSEPGTKVDSRHLELASISRGLKVLAGELDVPIMALSQLSRQAVQRERPSMSDLRDSGGLESDADLVALLWRGEKDEEKMLGELRLDKQRNGPTGIVHLHWDGPCACYRDAARQYEEPF